MKLAITAHGALAILTLVQASTPVRGQAFEVASVKQNKSEDFRGIGMQFFPGGRFTATNMPLRLLITSAYGLPMQSVRLTGAPGWINGERYNVEAIAEKDAIPAGLTENERDRKIRLMLQALLADRFKLAIHRETRELPLYALTVSKKGSRLQKSKIDEKDCPTAGEGLPFGRVPGGEAVCHAFSGGQGRGIHGKGVTVPDVVKFVENWSDRPIVDQTGIKGVYDISTEGWVPLLPRPGAAAGGNDEGLSDPTRPTLFSIFEQLGLKLEAQKGMVEILVIDHVERPSEN